MRIVFTFCYFCCFCFHYVWAQNGTGFELQLSAGAVLPEYSFVNQLVKKNIFQIESSLFKQSRDENPYNALYAYPQFGVSGFYSSLGNKAVFGQEFALYPYVSFRSGRNSKLHFRNKLGLGLGFASKRFDLSTNFENVAVGSHLNLHFTYQTGFEYDLLSQMSLFGTLNFHHFSNANMKEPNLGLNMLSLGLGLNYSFDKRPNLQLQTSQKPEYKRHELAFVAAIGGKHTRALQAAVFITSSISGEYRYSLTPVFALGAGLDCFYDSSTETEITSKGKEYRNSYDYSSGIHLSQTFTYHRFRFILEEGFYLGLREHINESMMYNRAIMRYKMSYHFSIHLSMKSRLHILDYPELGLVYIPIFKR